VELLGARRFVMHRLDGAVTLGNCAAERVLVLTVLFCIRSYLICDLLDVGLQVSAGVFALGEHGLVLL
jgi:hypothetical protein